MANLTSAAEVAALVGCSEDDVRQAWLDDADARIYRHLGYQYTGQTQVYTTYGDDGQYLRTPTPASAITSITEDGAALAADNSAYKLMNDGRLIRRASSSFTANRAWWGGVATWMDEVEYVVTYVELTDPPQDVRLVATEFVGTIVLFAKKYGMTGLAISANATGTQAGGSMNLTYSYPARLVTELDAIIRTGLPRQGV